MTSAMDRLVDAERGSISRRIFIEPEIYEKELQQSSVKLRVPARREFRQFPNEGPVAQASARYSGGTPADAQAAQETGGRTEVAGHRQAGLLRLGFPATAPHLPS